MTQPCSPAADHDRRAPERRPLPAGVRAPARHRHHRHLPVDGLVVRDDDRAGGDSGRAVPSDVSPAERPGRRARLAGGAGHRRSSSWWPSSCRWPWCSAWWPAKRCACRLRWRPASRRWSPIPTSCRRLLEELPFYEHIAPYRAQILARAGELIGNLGRFAVVVDLGDHRRHGLGDPAVLHPALHAVLPADRRPDAAAQDDQLPAAAREREGAGPRQVRLGHPRDAARHAGHRHRPGHARRAVVLGRRHRRRALLGHHDGGAVGAAGRRRRAGLGAGRDRAGDPGPVAVGARPDRCSTP